MKALPDFVKSVFEKNSESIRNCEIYTKIISKKNFAFTLFENQLVLVAGATPRFEVKESLILISYI